MPFSQTYSDIVFDEHGQAFLKGTPGITGVSPVPTADLKQAEALYEHAKTAVTFNSDTFLSFEENRFRVKKMPSATYEKEAYCLYLRKIPKTISTLEKLGFKPSDVAPLFSPEMKSGLILFAGAQGAGKTTSSATCIKERLTRVGGTALTIECPPEYDLNGAHGKSGWCQQTSVSNESEIPAMMVGSYRCSSPNILFLGEIREGNVAVEAMRAAIANYIVVSTIHADSIISACNRLLMFAQETMEEKASLKLFAEAFQCCFHQELYWFGNKKELAYTLLRESSSVYGKLAAGQLRALQDDIELQTQRRSR